MLRVRILAVLVLLGIFSVISLAQAPGTGLYAFGSFDNRGFDSINVANLNVHFTIPIVSKPGRGMNFNYTLAYDSMLWNAVSSGGQYVWSPEANWGLSGQLNGALTGYMTANQTLTSCPPSGGSHLITTVSYYTNYIFHDSLGATHPFNYSYGTTTCGTPYTSQGDGSTSDNSGLFFDGTKVHTPDGHLIDPLGTIVDSNGNTIAVNFNGTITDTLGATALAITGAGTAISPLTFTYNVARQVDAGTTAAVIMTYHTYTIQTNFGCPNIAEYGPQSINLVDRITLADGTYYQFDYEDTPGVGGAKTGRLSSVTLPTGGTISYHYSGGCNGNGLNADGTIGSLSRVTSDGTRSYTRTVVNSSPPYYTYKTLVQDEANNQTLYHISTSILGGLYETHRQVYQGSVGGTPLLDRQICYNGVAPPCEGFGVGVPIIQTEVNSSRNGGAPKKTIYAYDAASSLLENEEDFDYDGTLLQTALYSYVSPGRLSSAEVRDSSNQLISKVTYGYDEGSLTTTSGIPQHIAVSGPRGNQTSSHTWINSVGTLDTSTSYYDTGVPVSSTDPNGATQYSYDSTQGFATQVTPPTPSSGVSLPSYASYDANSGIQLSASDANSPNTLQVQYSQYDSLLRPKSINTIDGGNTSYEYDGLPNSLGFPYVRISSTVGGGVQNADTDIAYDSYGRVSRIATYNGGPAASDWYQTDYCYDAVGNLQFVSVRYQDSGFAASKRCSGSGTTYTHDALGRVTNISNPDGNKIIHPFGRAVMTTEMNGAQKIVQKDRFGRISAVCELSSNSLQGDSPQNCGLDIPGTGYLTTYTYDLTNHKTTVTQGVQTRIFQTDFLGRTIFTQEPESGQTSYSYAYNATGLVVTRTRPRANQGDPNVKTNTFTQYDKMGRVVGISYDDGTSNKSFAYDQATAWGNGTYSLGASKGHLTQVISSYPSGNWIGAGVFAYDSIGRVTTSIQCLPSGCGDGNYDRYLSYSYDLAGDIKSSSDGAGVTTSYTYSPAHEIASITSSTADATDPPSLVSNVQYGPYGPLTWNLGNGLFGYQDYDSLGRPFEERVCGNAPSLTCAPQPYGLNVFRSGSNISRVDDTVANANTGSTSNYSTDEFGRLSFNSIDYWNGAHGQTFGYVYDRYGNRWAQNADQGGPGPSYLFNKSNNHIADLPYDAAGNLLNDYAHSYTYDAEGNVTQVDGGSVKNYYNAFNQRVRQERAGTDTLEYVYNLTGQIASIWSGTTRNWIVGEYYWGSKPIAFYGAGSLHFQHQDWLGTERVRTSYNGAVEGTSSSFAFGDGFSGTGMGALPYQFGQLEQDSESATEHAQFRQYSSTMGRWMSPDPYSGSYNISNPQSLNRYSYVRNNPLAMIDPSGLSGVCVSAFPYGTAENYDIAYGINNSADCSSAYGTWVETGSDITMDVSSNGSDGSVADPGIGAIAVSPSSSANSNNGVGSVAPSKPAWNANLPSCWLVGGKMVADAFVDTLGPVTDLPGVIKELTEAGLKSASGLALIRASNYALTATNTLGGKGLLVPLRSSTYRAMLADSAELAEAASGAWIGLLDYNLVKQAYNQIANPTPCR